MPFDDVWDAHPVPLRGPAPARRRALMSETGAILITFLLCAALGGFSYVALSGQWPAFEWPTFGSPEAAPSAPVAATSPVAASAQPLAPAQAAAPSGSESAAPERASILIFTVRPGSIATSGPTRLCYAVRDALQTRIEPGIGDVDAATTLTCRRVVAVRTTTYELTAVGRDGVPVKQQVVIVAR